MKKRRFLSILCAAAMIAAAAVLPGCQQNGGESSSPASAAGSASAAPKEAPTLTWWVIGGGESPNHQEAVDKMNEYTAEKINVKIDLKMGTWDNWNDKMDQIVNSGEKFDIMFTNNTKYVKQVDLGAFADITDQVQQESPDLYKFIPEKLWEAVKIDGKIYSVPTYKDSSITQYWVFDDKYVQKYKIDVANTKTFEALDPVFTKIKQGEGKNVYPLSLTQGDAFAGMLNDYDDLTVGFKPIGVRIDDTNHKVVYTFEQPDVMSMLKYLHKWYQAGIINPDAPTKGTPSKGRIFFSAQGFPGAEAGWQVNENVAKYDTVQVAKPLYTNSTIQGSLNAISANSDHKAEALKYLQLVNTDQKLRDMLQYGEEGKDFEYVSPKVVKRLTNTWGPAGYSEGTFFDMATLSDAPADQWEQVKKLNEQAISSTSLGFTPDISNLSTEITNCTTTFAKYSYELLTGASDPEKMVPQIKKELESAGMDKIISELQTQLDAQFKK